VAGRPAGRRRRPYRREQRGGPARLIFHCGDHDYRQVMLATVADSCPSSLIVSLRRLASEIRLSQVKQSAVAQTALVKLAASSLFNDVLCECSPHEFDLLIRKPNPAGLDRLQSAVECGNQDADGVRIKYYVGL
jgi:hypothetical protein